MPRSVERTIERRNDTASATDTVLVRIAARNERSLIAGMLQPYLAELSTFTGAQAAGNGRYSYPYLDAYWEHRSNAMTPPTHSAHVDRVQQTDQIERADQAQRVDDGTTTAEHYARHPFLITLHQRIIGFSLVREVPGGTSIAEFFIKPEYRRKGYGEQAATAIFRAFPGRWAVRQQLMNAVSQAFWRATINTIDPHYEERIETTSDGKSTTVQRFSVVAD